MAAFAQTFAPSTADSALALARIRLTYGWSHGRLPDLAAARRFTEMVQLRKLYDRDPRQIARMDKLAAKRMAERLLGPEWATPTRICPNSRSGRFRSRRRDRLYPDSSPGRPSRWLHIRQR